MGDAPTLADEAGDDDADLELEGDDPEPEIGDVPEPEQTVADAAADLDLDDQGDPPGDVNEATVDLSEDDLGDGLFTGVEEGSSESSSSESSEGDGDQDGDGDGDALDEIADGLDGNAAAMEEAINDGAARMAVVGLTDEDFADSDLDKESLEAEFRETFSAFRLGYFGSQAVEEYVLTPADGDVSPAWGLAGSVLIAAAMVVWLRPDGDEAVQRARNAIGDIGGGA